MKKTFVQACCYCMRIKNTEGKYEGDARELDREKHEVSHGYCPECYEKYVEPDIIRTRNESKSNRD